MLQFEKIKTFNFDNAIRGMRNPHESYDKADSFAVDDDFVIGTNDLKLAKNLIQAGTDHSKFMRQIMVSVDITGPLFWWKEFDTYKVGTVANSTSTMHSIHKKEFTFDDFSLKNKSDYFAAVVDVLNKLRFDYITTKDKSYWREIIELLPSSYNQKRTVTLNYAVLRNIYISRKNHKLTEWSVDFMSFIDSLPYSELITLK